MTRSRRPRVAIVTPFLAEANNGNWQTAARYRRCLSDRYRVTVGNGYAGAPDLLIALHARRSAAPVARFAAEFPQRPLIVVLTGTDLYRDIDRDPDARRSLALATKLVVLNDAGAARLAPELRPKAVVILQSARPMRPAPRLRGFNVAVVGHLRAEKNPQLVWRVLDRWPADEPLRIWHAGRALDAELGREAARRALTDPRYRWLGDQPRSALRRRVRACQVLLHPSHMEGGALAVIEAVTAHTPVIGSRIDGNTGLLGDDYPGLFAPDDADAACELLLRAARDERFLALLARRCARAARRFTPQRECAALRRLVTGCLRAAARPGSALAARTRPRVAGDAST